ncbi:MAG: hypothetical protein SVQ76_01245 [Candidatus Nanohaloarchaea archaeon]|nr:hypothetical protein [Candidatus Nanohaloarchaea archaeon]
MGLIDSFTWKEKLGAGTLLIALILALMLVFPSGKAEVEERNGVVRYGSGQVYLNVSNMTDSEVHFDSTYELAFRGDPTWVEYMAKGVYLGDIFLNNLTRKGETLFRVTPRLYPKDGVPEAYIVPVYREEEQGFGAEVYIDEDFRDAVDNVSVAWGGSRYFGAFRRFNYSEEVFEGVYRDEIPVYNPEGERITPSTRRWAVGNFTYRIMFSHDIDRYIGAILS